MVMTFGAKGVGDHVACSSFVRNLARNRPGAAIDVGVFSSVGAELFRHNPHIRNIHMVDMDYLKVGGKYRFRDSVRYISRFRRIHYDKIYVLGSKFRHAVFAFLIGGKERIGYDMANRDFLLTKTGREPIEKNVVERFLDLLVLDGMHIIDSGIELFLSENETKTVEQMFARLGILESDTVLCLAPFAADMRRTWGLRNFWKTALHFAEMGQKVLVLGSSEERKHLTKYPLPRHPGIIDAVGKFTILETAAAIKRGALFLGNDSGLGHIAGAVRTTALILGYYITRVWHPFSPSVKTIIKETGCTTCNLNNCIQGENVIPKCFASIPVSEVIDTLTEMLSKEFIHNLRT